MRVSFVSESRVGELRPLLLPHDIQYYFKSLPVEIYIEAGIGKGVDLSDADYLNSVPQAQIVDKDTAWQKADVLLKLKRPSLEEIRRLRSGATIVAFFHAEDAPHIVDLLIKHRIRAYSYEYFQTEDGDYPLMQATGEIAGKMAVIYAAYHLQSQLGGSGYFLASCRSAIPARAAVLGYGNVGRAAIDVLKGLGAEIHVFRWSYQEQSEGLGDDPNIVFHPWDSFIADQIIPTCDVVIGAVRISTFDTPPFITREMVKKMKRGSVIVDVTAGYGTGYIATVEQITTLNAPFFVVEGVKHIRIRELPLGVHRTASQQISAQFAPHLAALVEALANDRVYDVAERGKITESGRILNDHVKHHCLT